MSLCAIIPVANLQAANDALEQAGYGPFNFSVPLYSSTGASYGGLHAAGDLPFEAAIKAIAGVIWEESNGDPTTRFKALVEAQGVKWGANAPPLPSTGMVNAGEVYRTGDIGESLLWYVIQSFDRGVFNLPPETYPALLARFAEPGVVCDWWQPLTQYDAPKLVNPFTGSADKRKHNGKVWIVAQADGAGNNTWEPGVFGWTEWQP